MQQTLRTTVWEGTLWDPCSFLFNWIGNSYENSLFREAIEIKGAASLHHVYNTEERDQQSPGETCSWGTEARFPSPSTRQSQGFPDKECDITSYSQWPKQKCYSMLWSSLWLLQNSKWALIIVQNNQKQCLPRYVLYALCIEFFFLITGASCCSDVSFSSKMQGGMQAEFLIEEEDLALISSAKRHPPTLMRTLQLGHSGNQRILERVAVCSN